MKRSFVPSGLPSGAPSTEPSGNPSAIPSLELVNKSELIDIKYERAYIISLNAVNVSHMTFANRLDYLMLFCALFNHDFERSFTDIFAVGVLHAKHCVEAKPSESSFV